MRGKKNLGLLKDDAEIYGRQSVCVNSYFLPWLEIVQREHLLLGEGELDLKKFLRTLEAARPDITVTVELHPPATKEAVTRAIQDSMVYLRDAFKAGK